MRGIFKKITSVIAVASLAASAGSLTAFADEAQPFELAEDDYYICDDLDISKEDVSDIIDKVNDMYLSGEITAEIAEDMVNAFSASANEDTYEYPANDFFLAAMVHSGTTLTESNKITFTIKRTAPNYQVRLVDNNNKLSVGNAVPSMTESNIVVPSYSTSVGSDGIEYATYTTNVINTVTTANDGVLLTLRIKLLNSVNNHTIGGNDAYNILRANNYAVANINGVTLMKLDEYKNVGSLGDIDNNGIVDNADRQKLINYLLHNEGFDNAMQFAAADVTENGEVDVRDYSLLSSYISGVYTNLRSINS